MLFKRLFGRKKTRLNEVRNKALSDYRDARKRRDTRGMHCAHERLMQATHDLMRAEQ